MIVDDEQVANSIPFNKKLEQIHDISSFDFNFADYYQSLMVLEDRIFTNKWFKGRRQS